MSAYFHSYLCGRKAAEWLINMQQYMDAIVKPNAGPGLELRKVPVPQPGPGEVLIKVHKTAICGTDVHIYNWDPWAVGTSVRP